MVEKVVNIKVQETGFDDLNAKVNRLENSLEDLEQQNQSLRGSFASSGKSVLDNGGAMGLLNDVTGGLAMTVKDAVEATDLFTKSTKAQTVFQKIATTVIGTSTGAMKAFRIALAATGIGLIVVALGLLVANFDKVQKYVQKGIDKFKGLGEGAKLLISFLFPVVGIVRLITAALEEMGVIDDDATKKAKKNAEERIKALDKQKVSIEEKYESEIRLAKAAGKDTVELEEAKRKAILKTLYALNEAERARIKSGEATEDEIKKWNERQKEIKKVVEDGKVAILEQEKDREEKIKEINKKALEDRKARQDSIKRLNEGYVKQLHDLDAKTEEEKLALDRKRAEAELNNLKATEDEKLALKALYDRKEEDLLKTKQTNIDNITNEYNNKLRELNAKTDEEKFQLELTKQQEEEDKKIAELEKLNATEAEKQKIRDYYIQLEKDTRDNFNLSEEEKRKAVAAKKIEDEKALAEQLTAVELAYQEAKRGALDTGLNILMQFAGKNKAIALGILAIQKGLAVADVVVGAAKAIGLAKASMAPTPLNPVFLGPGIPNPSYFANLKAGTASILTTKIGAATSIASILAAGIGQASQITAGGGGSGGGDTGGGGGGSVPSAPSFNLVGGTGTNQIAQSLAMQNKPIQSFVVGSAVTSQQELDRRAVANASL
jgi:hypothetical protein